MDRIYCKKCGKELLDFYPQHIRNDEHYCGDCAFINGFIDEKSLKKDFYFFIPFEILGTPIVVNNKIEWVSKSYLNKKETSKERYTPEYREWRNKVYERDNYTCQKCGQVGGTLNAHHIELFSECKAKRIDVSNGITLCEKCHKKLHKEMKERKGL